MDTDLIVYQVSRQCVEAGDLSHLVAQFDIGRLSDVQLRQYFGRIVFIFEGYDAHPDELHTIPAVRLFIRKWHGQNPHLLFFGSLLNDNLKVLYLSLLESLECLQVRNAGLARTNFDFCELANLLAADVTHADALCVRLGISPSERLRRTTELLRYFNIVEGGRP